MASRRDRGPCLAGVGTLEQGTGQGADKGPGNGRVAFGICFWGYLDRNLARVLASVVVMRSVSPSFCLPLPRFGPRPSILSLLSILLFAASSSSSTHPPGLFSIRPLHFLPKSNTVFLLVPQATRYTLILASSWGRGGNGARTRMEFF